MDVALAVKTHSGENLGDVRLSAISSVYEASVARDTE
jgi:hypothetical protein